MAITSKLFDLACKLMLSSGAGIFYGCAIAVFFTFSLVLDSVHSLKSCECGLCLGWSIAPTESIGSKFFIAQ
jgi:hypothetical protein